MANQSINNVAGALSNPQSTAAPFGQIGPLGGGPAPAPSTNQPAFGGAQGFGGFGGIGQGSNQPAPAAPSTYTPPGGFMPLPAGAPAGARPLPNWFANNPVVQGMRSDRGLAPFPTAPVAGAPAPGTPLPQTPGTPAPVPGATPPPPTGIGGPANFQVANYDTSDPNSPFYDPNRPGGYDRPIAQIGAQIPPEMLANNPQLAQIMAGFQQAQIAGIQRQNQARYERAVAMAGRNRIGEIGDPKQAARNAAMMAEYNLTSAPQHQGMARPDGRTYANQAEMAAAYAANPQQGTSARVAAGGQPYTPAAYPAAPAPAPAPGHTPGTPFNYTPMMPYEQDFNRQLADNAAGVPLFRRPNFNRGGGQ